MVGVAACSTFFAVKPTASRPGQRHYTARATYSAPTGWSCPAGQKQMAVVHFVLVSLLVSCALASLHDVYSNAGQYHRWVLNKDMGLIEHVPSSLPSLPDVLQALAKSPNVHNGRELVSPAKCLGCWCSPWNSCLTSLNLCIHSSAHAKWQSLICCSHRPESDGRSRSWRSECNEAACAGSQVGDSASASMEHYALIG